MNIPGFIAEASVYRTATCFHRGGITKSGGEGVQSFLSFLRPGAVTGNVSEKGDGLFAELCVASDPIARAPVLAASSLNSKTSP
jgi:hypothetical protein